MMKKKNVQKALAQKMMMKMDKELNKILDQDQDPCHDQHPEI